MATGKRAIQRLVRGEDGRMRTILIDLLTLQPVVDPSGYTVVNALNSLEPEPVENVDEPDKPQTTAEDINEEVRDVGHDGSSAAGKTNFGGSKTSGVGPTRGSFPSAPAPFDNASVQSRTTAGNATTANRTRTEQAISQGSVATRESTKSQGGVATPESTKGMTSKPGGFANLVDRSQVGFDTSGLQGKGRPNAPAESLSNNIRESVGNVYGAGSTVSAQSGMENAGRQVGSGRHKTGLSLDFDVVDPTGKVSTNKVAQEDVAMDFAARNPEAGIGYGTGYMSPGRMHLDTTGLGKSWGAMNTRANMDQNFARNLDFARQTGIGPTPTFDAPTPFGPEENNPNALAEATGGFKGSTAKGIISEAKNVNPSVGRNLPDISKATPAEMAAMGFTNRTPEQIDAISKAVSGEVSKKTFDAAMNPDDPNNAQAREHIGNIVASIENRAASQKFGTLENALVGSQYNALMPEKMETTNKNYGVWGTQLSGLIGSYYAGQLTPSNYSISSYYNPEEVNPNWGGLMTDVSSVLDHKFGSLPEYGPSKAFEAERSRMAAGQVSDTRGFTPEKDYSGSGYTGKTDSPREGNASGLGSGGGFGGLSSGSGRTDGGFSNSGGISNSGSNHATEHERDNSLGGGGYSAGAGRGNSIGGQGIGGAGNKGSHAAEHERDGSLGGGGSTKSDKGGYAAGSNDRGGFSGL